MADHFNKLDPEDAELLAILAEECGEVTQRIGKILRHGIGNVSPYTGLNNRDGLEAELTDLITLLGLLNARGIISSDRISEGVNGKLHRLARPGILHHSSTLRPLPCVRCGSMDHFQQDLRKGDSTVSVCVDTDGCWERQGRNIS